MPLFTVITVCRNAGRYLEKTIESVLEQNCRDLEYIVMDGGSSDGTVKIANSYKEKFAAEGIDYAVYSEKDNGIYEGMNNALSHATGEYVNFMNADDRFYSPDVLAKAAGIISEAEQDKNGKPFVFYGDAAAIEFGQRYRFIKDVSVIELKMPFSHQSVFAARELLQKYPFDESYRIGADYDFLLNAYKSGATFYDLGIPVCEVTLDGLSSVNLLKTFVETVKIQREHGIDLYPGNAYDKKTRELKVKQFVMDHFPKCIIRMIRKLQRIHRGQNEHC